MGEDALEREGHAGHVTQQDFRVVGLQGEGGARGGGGRWGRDRIAKCERTLCVRVEGGGGREPTTSGSMDPCSDPLLHIYTVHHILVRSLRRGQRDGGVVLSRVVSFSAGAPAGGFLAPV